MSQRSHPDRPAASRSFPIAGIGLGGKKERKTTSANHAEMGLPFWVHSQLLLYYSSNPSKPAKPASWLSIPQNEISEAMSSTSFQAQGLNVVRWDGFKLDFRFGGEGGADGLPSNSLLCKVPSLAATCIPVSAPARVHPLLAIHTRPINLSNFFFFSRSSLSRNWSDF